MTRIRYYKDDAGILTTNVLFGTMGALRGIINSNNNEIKIINKDGIYAVQYNATSVLDAKKAMRQGFINLGVEFHKERRIRKIAA